MSNRIVSRIIRGQPAADGDGVKLSRVLSPNLQLDPFLLLDEFNSDEAADYIGGFPAHPHRGFETVTYMLEGNMLHEDHLGNQGRLTGGSVQWMTAGRGVIHSEMPQQEEGRMRGFQLWLNLPAAEKMKPAAYRDIPPQDIPTVEEAGARVRVIAGGFESAGARLQGPVAGVSTEPLYLDVTLAPQAEFNLPLPREHTALAYVFDGSVEIAEQSVQAGQLAVLSPGETVGVNGAAEGGRLLLLAAKPLHEPVVHYGPFVMNTVKEVEQALRDYRDGRLTA